jgi:secreted PhoX family phosphatase
MMKAKLLALAVAAAVAGPVAAGDIQFTNAAVPTNDLDKRSVLTSNFAIVDGEKVDVNYNVLLRTGDQPHRSKAPFGLVHDIEGQPVVMEDGSLKLSDDNDFSSIVRGKRGGLFMVSHFESRPAAMYLTKLHQDRMTGELTAVKTRPLDFSHVNGGWVHCAGSVSPWNTHLGSEEYPPNSREWIDGNISGYNAEMVRYFPEARGAATADLPALAQQHMNPYDYGFIVEVDVKNFRKADVIKHYSMGRVAIELSYVMPNQKTVYISDDGSRVGLFRYEADVAGDLSSGELFAAKWSQTSPWTNDQERIHPLDGGAGEISWISLGHATDEEIRTLIDSGLTFSDIFEADGQDCTNIRTRDGSDCLTVKPGMEKAAAFLETSRYAALQGATIEFEKMEGITLNPETNTMYLAMSRVRSGMSDGEGHMSVPYNYCGTVYALDLDENYVATNMYGLVNGIPRLYKRGAAEDNPYPADGPYAANECDLNGISEPDNITYMPGYDTLIIGEDTGKHQNDMIWSYNLASEELTRVQTTPYGSETTSPYFYPNVNGFAYVMSVIQHPFGESDQGELVDDQEARAYTGYIGPFPAMGEGDSRPWPKPWPPRWKHKH